MTLTWYFVLKIALTDFVATGGIVFHKDLSFFAFYNWDYKHFILVLYFACHRITNEG